MIRVLISGVIGMFYSKTRELWEVVRDGGCHATFGEVSCMGLNINNAFILLLVHQKKRYPVYGLTFDRVYCCWNGGK